MRDKEADVTQQSAPRLKPLHQRGDAAGCEDEDVDGGLATLLRTACQTAARVLCG